MLFAIVLCLAAVPFAHSEMIHNYMTPDEVMGVFHTTHDAVPEYEVVPIKHSRTNTEEGTEMQFQAFDNDIKLYLSPTEGYLAHEKTPLWTVRSDPRRQEGLRYRLLRRALKNIGTPLQDEKSGAALLATPQGNDRTVFDGFLASDMVVRSLPNRVVRDVMYGDNGLYEPKFMRNATEDDLVYTYHHVIYKKPQQQNYLDFKLTDPPGQFEQMPDVLYPQILVVVDYNLYLMLGRNIEQAKRYIVAFWNGVDLRYRLLSKPKIRLNLAGIVIALEMGAIPYVEKNRVDVAMVDADLALRGMADYFYRETRFSWDFYDVAIVMTQLDLCNMIFDDICDPQTLGYAYVAGACNRNETKQSSEAVGLAEDNGGFSGIITTAHELGHLIGARHDGNPTVAAECEPFDGYIMTSNLMLGENGFKWSNCSVKSFYKFLNEDRAKCLYNQPPPAKEIIRTLPGKMMSLDEQCKKIYGTAACNKNETSVCYRLECEVPGSGGLCRAISPAAEGSSCGDSLICIDGECVLEGTPPKDPKSKTPKSPRPYFTLNDFKPYFLDN